MLPATNERWASPAPFLAFFAISGTSYMTTARAIVRMQILFLISFIWFCFVSFCQVLQRQIRFKQLGGTAAENVPGSLSFSLIFIIYFVCLPVSFICHQFIHFWRGESIWFDSFEMITECLQLVRVGAFASSKISDEFQFGVSLLNEWTIIWFKFFCLIYPFRNRLEFWIWSIVFYNQRRIWIHSLM